MANEPHQPTPADPVRSEPAEAPPETGASLREPDPTDEFMRMLKRLAGAGTALTEDLAADAREEIAARRAARAAAAARAAVSAESASPPAADPAVAAPESAVESGAEPTPQATAARDRAMLGFYRMTRAVRLSMSLALKFQSDRLEREQKGASDAAKAERERKARRKQQIKTVIRQAIEREIDARAAAHEAAQEQEGFEQEGLEEDEPGDFGAWELTRSTAERLDQEDIERDLDRCSIGELVARVCRSRGFEPEWQSWHGDFWAQDEARLQTPGSPYAGSPGPEAPGLEADEPEAPEPDVGEPEPPELEPPEAELAEPEPPEPEAEDPHEARMKARLAEAMHSGAWIRALEVDPKLAAYVRARLSKSG